MSLELKPKENDTIDVYSGVRLIGTIINQLSPEGKSMYFFKPNHDCGCVWRSESLFELAEILLKMNQK